MNQKKSTGPKSIPSVVQLSGGIVLQGMQFVITAWNESGAPTTFELLPEGKNGDPKDPNNVVLFASEKLLRSRWPGK